MPFAVATIALLSIGVVDSPARPLPAASAPALATPSLLLPRLAPTSRAGSDQEAAHFRLQAPAEPNGSTDLALYVGRRDRGAQFEFGALGGGRSDAPGLVHVGIGWDF